MNKGGIVLVVIGIILLIVSLGFTIKGANECAAKGGTYIVAKGSVPACVKEIK